MVDPNEIGSTPSRSRVRPVLASLLWLLSAAALLTVGFLSWVYIGYRVATSAADPSSIRTTQTAFVLYAKWILLKGLLPQLLLALLMWPVLNRVFSLDERGRWGIALGLMASSALAAAVVVPTLMTSDLLNMPSVKFRDSWNFMQTYLEMTIGVSAVLLLTRLFRRNPGDPGPVSDETS